MSKSTLLLRCCGPMQSWCAQGAYKYRITEKHPTKSGVIGLLRAAMGYAMWEYPPGSVTPKQLCNLRFGVRFDKPGNVEVDYQTAGMLDTILQADGKPTKQGNMVIHRYFLSDADFLVGLEGIPSVLAKLQCALAAPAYVLTLGRQCFPATESIWLRDGLVSVGLEDALKNYPALRNGSRMRVHVEKKNGQRRTYDQPNLSKLELFLPRFYSEYHVDLS